MIARGMAGVTRGSQQTVFDIKSEDKLKTFQSQLQDEDCMKNSTAVDKAVFL